MGIGSAGPGWLGAFSCWADRLTGTAHFARTFLRMKRVVLRVEKHKTAATAAAAARHWFRLQVTPNADPTRAHLNRTLIGSGDLQFDIRAALGRVDKPIRKDAVRWIDGILSASPDFFETPGSVETFAAAARDYLAQEFGGNIVAAVLHRDEKTPHVHFAAVPLKTDARGRTGLSAKEWLGGRQKMQALQERAGRALARLGLERGRKGSKARHSTLRAFYARLDEIKAAAAEKERTADDERLIAQYERQQAEEIRDGAEQMARRIEAMRKRAARVAPFLSAAERLALRDLSRTADRMLDTLTDKDMDR